MAIKRGRVFIAGGWLLDLLGGLVLVLVICVGGRQLVVLATIAQ